MSVELNGDAPKSNHKNPKPSVDTKHNHSGGKDINILLLGRKGVGKTAITVRYLTKRFIGDYNSEMEMLYSHSTNIDGKHITLHIIDTLGQNDNEEVSAEQVLWADCVVVVYAITDQESFDTARKIVEFVHSVRGEDNQLPVALVANKADLIERKTVSDTEVTRLCAEFNLWFFETSASETQHSVVEVFSTLSRQVRHVMKKKEKLTRFMSNPAVAAKLQIQQSLKNFAERTWRARTSTL